MRYHVLKLSPSRLAALCPEIILEIMRVSSPADLRMLRSVSRLFYHILNTHPSCWTHARRAISLPPPPPGLPAWREFTQAPFHFPVQLGRGAIEAAYAGYLFGGGSCTVCGNWSSEIPHSLGLSFRCCSPKCRQLVYVINHKHLLHVRYMDRFDHPGSEWLSHQPTKYGGLFFRSELAAAKKTLEYLRVEATRVEFQFIREFRAEACRHEMKMVRNLQDWKPNYMDALRDTRDSNITFLKSIALKHRIKVAKLLSSPTLQRVFDAFNRDLTSMTSMGGSYLVRIY
ncbi:hypothetical protein DFH06DRAFT_1187871 [Mycena polygramma]|nr:hypothetical protein DFH06DRAFT_1187871 [Mycena polygramma]